ncbi:uncharacterized protein LOC120350215 [Nilaparvata lugens]|uniref:uncharacterized protein LOC120350215 n=1 Tax=Nilaparvata lugens TaxID=108931 RepID=UPI00193D3136|nr:uncharacterized protein LOC120350215 [Nilaparvata lugens]
MEPSIMCITEHWLKEEESNFYGNIGTISLASIYCRNLHKNGGAAIYLNKKLQYKIVEVTNYCKECTLELAAVELVDYHIIVVSVYHPPNGDFEGFTLLLDEFLSFILSRQQDRIIIGGDFNVHLEIPSKERDIFVNLLRSHNLFVGSLCPTRGDACLDTMITNLNSWEYTTRVVDPFISDHSAVVLQANLHKTEQTQEPWKANYISYSIVVREERIPILCRKLEGINWTEVFGLTKQEYMLDILLAGYVNVFNTVFPKTMRKVSRNSRRGTQTANRPWFDETLAQVKNLVVLLHHKYKTAATPEDKNYWLNQYQKQKKEYRIQVGMAKRNYTSETIMSADNNCKAAWDIINTHHPKKPQMESPLNPDDFNNYFVSVAENILQELPDCGSNPMNNVGQVQQQMMDWKLVSADRVTKIVSNLKNSRSQDIYGLSTFVLKATAKQIAEPLAAAINSCFVAGRFPDCLKTARTVPIHKKEETSDPANFRPISMVPIFSKVIETEMKMQMTNFFEGNGLLSSSQHGFRNRRSTTSALLALTENIQRSFEDGESLALTLCDLSKAFDSLFHSHIIYGLLLWGHAPAVHDVLLLQKKALRIVTFSGFRDHCRPLFRDLGILTVYSQFVLCSLMYIKKNLVQFQKRCDIHSHNTRHATRLEVPRSRLAGNYNSFPSQAIRFFNSLPRPIQETPNSWFYTTLKSKLLEKPLYSLQEFYSEPLFGSQAPPQRE